MNGVRQRLLAEAERAAAVDLTTLSLEVIAESAGVSRATAYRHFGGRDELLVALAIVRSERLTAGAREVVEYWATAPRQLEEAVVYLAREIPGDPVIMAMVRRSVAVIDDPAVWATATAFLGPLVESARAKGEFRNDISVDETVHWLVEQLFLVVTSPVRDEAVVRRRITAFVLPSVVTSPAARETVRAAADALRSQARAISEIADGLSGG